MHRGANGQLRLLDLQPKGVKVSKHWGLPQRDCFFAGENAGNRWELIAKWCSKFQDPVDMSSFYGFFWGLFSQIFCLGRWQWQTQCSGWLCCRIPAICPFLLGFDDSPAKFDASNLWNLEIFGGSAGSAPLFSWRWCGVFQALQGVAGNFGFPCPVQLQRLPTLLALRYREAIPHRFLHCLT